MCAEKTLSIFCMKTSEKSRQRLAIFGFSREDLSYLRNKMKKNQIGSKNGSLCSPFHAAIATILTPNSDRTEPLFCIFCAVNSHNTKENCNHYISSTGKFCRTSAKPTKMWYGSIASFLLPTCLRPDRSRDKEIEKNFVGTSNKSYDKTIATASLSYDSSGMSFDSMPLKGVYTKYFPFSILNQDLSTLVSDDEVSVLQRNCRSLMVPCCAAKFPNPFPYT